MAYISTPDKSITRTIGCLLYQPGFLFIKISNILRLSFSFTRKFQRKFLCKIKTAIKTCNTRIKGIPITKYQCFVLCRKAYIPVQVPMLPPRILHINRLFSGIRHWFLIAFFLSAPINRKPTMLMIIRYPITNFVIKIYL